MSKQVRNFSEVCYWFETRTSRIWSELNGDWALDELSTARARRAIGLEAIPILFYDDNPPYFCFFESTTLIIDWPHPPIFKTIVLNLTMFYCFPWITFMARDFISTLRLTPSKWELTQWWKGDSPLTLWCKPNWESKKCKDQINLPVARIDCQTDGQKRIQFTTNWWMVLHFCPTYGVHDFRVSMEVYHMPTVLLNYQIKKKLPHKSPHLAQLFWVCPEIRVFLSLQTFARSLSCLVTMCMPLRLQLKINQFL